MQNTAMAFPLFGGNPQPQPQPRRQSSSASSSHLHLVVLAMAVLLSSSPSAPLRIMSVVGGLVGGYSDQLPWSGHENCYLAHCRRFPAGICPTYVHCDWYCDCDSDPDSDTDWDSDSHSDGSGRRRYNEIKFAPFANDNGLYEGGLPSMHWGKIRFIIRYILQQPYFKYKYTIKHRKPLKDWSTYIDRRKNVLKIFYFKLYIFK